MDAGAATRPATWRVDLTGAPAMALGRLGCVSEMSGNVPACGSYVPLDLLSCRHDACETSPWVGAFGHPPPSSTTGRPTRATCGCAGTRSPGARWRAG